MDGCAQMNIKTVVSDLIDKHTLSLILSMYVFLGSCIIDFTYFTKYLPHFFYHLVCTSRGDKRRTLKLDRLE